MLQLQRLPRFPQELTDMIIDHLWDDRPSLSLCCQVARCWLQSSRSHLFHEISVPVSKSKPDTIPEFVNLLHSSTQVGHHIRTLFLCRPNDLSVEHSSLDIEAVAAILSKLPNLLQFYLHGIDLTLLKPSAAKDICLPSLQRLSFSFVKIFGGLSSALSYFPQVDSLDVLQVLIEQPRQTVSTESDSPDGSVVSPKRPTIRCLSLETDGRMHNYPIHQDLQLEFLSKLYYSFSGPVQLQVIAPIIRRAPRLKVLDLWLDGFGSRHEPANLEEWAELDLASVTSLETLSIGFLLGPVPDPHDDAIWLSVISLLSLAPLTLSNITLIDLFSVFTDHGEKRLEGLDWKSLEQSLSRFSQLKRVVFPIGPDEYEAAVSSGKYDELSKRFKEVLQRQLPDLHLKGKLEVDLELPIK